MDDKPLIDSLRVFANNLREVTIDELMTELGQEATKVVVDGMRHHQRYNQPGAPVGLSLEQAKVGDTPYQFIVLAIAYPAVEAPKVGGQVKHLVEEVIKRRPKTPDEEEKIENGIH